MQSKSWEILGWMKHELESIFGGEITASRYADDTTLMAESEEGSESLGNELKALEKSSLFFFAT